MNNELNKKPTPKQLAALAYQVWENEGGSDGQGETYRLEVKQRRAVLDKHKH